MDSSHGYIYLSKDAVSGLPSNGLQLDHISNTKDHVYIRVIHTDGTQEEGRIEQLNTNPNQDLSISLGQCMTQYSCPSKRNFFGSTTYQYVAFFDAIQPVQGQTRGFRSNGVNIQFTNCDTNPSSYFGFHANPNAETVTPQGFNGKLFSDWLNSLTGIAVENYIDEATYGFVLEAGQGGCGYNVVSNQKSAIGLPFGKFNNIDILFLCINFKQ